MLILEVLVNEAATTATFSVTYSKVGKVVSIQKGSITLHLGSNGPCKSVNLEIRGD